MTVEFATEAISALSITLVAALTIKKARAVAKKLALIYNKDEQRN